MMALKPLEMARYLIRDHVSAGDCVVDGTVGNGHDALFLAELVGRSGKVVGYDVQAEAIESTRRRLREAGIEDKRVLLQHAGHEDLAELPGEVGDFAAAMFNFGYLPGSDKAVITRTETSLTAVRAALHRLAAGGVMTLMCYPGHAGGAEEAGALTEWAAGLDGREWRVVRVNELNGGASKPFLIAVQARR